MKRSMLQIGLKSVAVIAALLRVHSASAQLAAVAQPAGDDAPASNNPPGFSVHKEQRPVWDAFEDFERYRDKKAWEKAFGALSKIDEG